MGLREGFRRETLRQLKTLEGESERDCKGRKEEEPPRSEVPMGAGRILADNRRQVERMSWMQAVWV